MSKTAGESYNHSQQERNGQSCGGQWNFIKLMAVLAVTALVFIVEMIGAVVSGSLALAADAGHMAVDSSGLLLAVITAWLLRRPASNRLTWGWARMEVLSAAFQAGMLLFVSISVALEAWRRAVNPELVNVKLMLIVGAFGMGGNLVGMFILAADRKENLNLRAAFLEVTVDVFGSLIVIVSGCAMLLWKIDWLDIPASFLLAALMAPRAVMLLITALRILLEGTPLNLDIGELRSRVLAIEHVVDVHDLHLNVIGSRYLAVSLHATLDDCCFQNGHCVKILHDIQAEFAEGEVSIPHSTIQLDSVEHRDHEPLAHPADNRSRAHLGHAH